MTTDTQNSVSLTAAEKLISMGLVPEKGSEGWFQQKSGSLFFHDNTFQVAGWLSFIWSSYLSVYACSYGGSSLAHTFPFKRSVFVLPFSHCSTALADCGEPPMKRTAKAHLRHRQCRLLTSLPVVMCASATECLVWMSIYQCSLLLPLLLHFSLILPNRHSFFVSLHKSAPFPVHDIVIGSRNSLLYQNKC